MPFDPLTLADRATDETPHQTSVGVREVYLIGETLRFDGKPTATLPGRIVLGPGYRLSELSTSPLADH